jgi:hypothetical protein
MQPIRLIFIVFVTTIAGFLASCETQPPQLSLPEMSFAHLPAFKLDAARVELASEYTSPMAPPHVEHQVPASPDSALRRWARDRLTAGGMAGVARFTIIEASVVESDLPVTKGITGAFTKDQARRYTAVVDAKVELFDDRGFRRGIATSRSSLSRTLPEGITLNERDKALYTLVEDLMKSFDEQMSANIRQYLSAFLF